MDHFYQFAKVPNQVPAQEFQETVAVKANWPLDPANPAIGKQERAVIREQGRGQKRITSGAK